MDQKASIQISSRVFIQSLAILLALMIVAGILTLTVSQGAYARQEVGGREVIVPGSYAPAVETNQRYPIWRWFTAPVEVLWGPDAAVIWVIIIFLFMVGIAFAVMERTGILQASIAAIVRRFGGRKYLLLLVLSFFFMLTGAFLGIFEEVVPLVPLVVALSYSLGWDAMVGLGMSILATNLGFSAAMTNPFTIGVAQKIAGLPAFSGLWFRIPIFLVIYAAFAVFITAYARKIERPVEQVQNPGAGFDLQAHPAPPRKAMLWLAACFSLVLLVLVASPFVPFLSDISLPLIGLLVLISGIGAGALAGAGAKSIWNAAISGAVSIAPAVPLILMAASVKFIIAEGGIMDTLLFQVSGMFDQASPFTAALLVYAVALILEFFISSGSAKAFLVMPILLPLADLVGVTRQVAVTAYCFGDGFTNLAYPTNPVLLICLGLVSVGYARWMRWTLPLWLMVAVITFAFLALGVAIHLGPF